MYLPQLKRTTVTTKAVYDMETGELLHWEGYTHFGPLDLCEGADAAPDPDTPDPAAEGGDGGESYFLEVDDRTRYRTLEEAQAGFRSAGERIAELAPYQQVVAEYGLTSPDDVAALLDELGELRAQANARQPAAAPGAPTNTPVATPTNTDPNSPEGKQIAALEWLKTNGEKAGLVSATQVQEIKDALENLSTQTQSFENERFQQRMDYGHNIVKDELKAAGFYPSDPKDTKGIEAGEKLAVFIERSMTEWVNQDQRRINAFHAGGESLASLIKAGLQEMLPTLNVLRSSSGATYTAGKARAANSGQRPLPPGSRTPAPAKKVSSTRDLKEADGITPDIHEAAYKVFQQIRGDQA